MVAESMWREKKNTWSKTFLSRDELKNHELEMLPDSVSLSKALR